MKLNFKKICTYSLITLLMIMGFFKFILGGTGILTINKIEGSSMYPTYNSGDLVVSTNVNLDVKRGDIVIAKNNKDQLVIKRVLGLPNETIKISNNQVYINGTQVKEDYIFFNDNLYNDIEVTLNSDEFYILGDNRSGSRDSREYGPITKDNIIREVISVIK